LHRLVIHTRAIFPARLLYEQREIARIHDNALIDNDGFQVIITGGDIRRDPLKEIRQKSFDWEI
jgi:hypothetical protein